MKIFPADLIRRSEMHLQLHLFESEVNKVPMLFGCDIFTYNIVPETDVSWQTLSHLQQGVLLKQ